MKKNGFTLVELLAVIVILAIVLGIVVTNVFNLYEETKQAAYEKQIEMIKESTKQYVVDNKRELFSSSNEVCINIATLVQEQYLTETPKDPRDETEFSSNFGFYVKKNSSRYTYEVVQNILTDTKCQN